jgi:hypothetical protein
VHVKGQPRFAGRPWLLILNGDVFDFLQVVSLPSNGRVLHSVKGVSQRTALSAHEREYGLGTTAVETEWKLKQIAKGHQAFFAAVGWFVGQGNHVVVVRRNHDVELHWQSVQERFIMEAKRASTRQWVREGGDPPPTLDVCRQRIRFCAWFYHEPGWVYVEHGCQYDAANHLGSILNPVLGDDPQRIELPWGSLFVRYLFNKVEDIHPFADNVKPLTRYLSWSFRKDPIKALRVLIGRGWVFLKAFWMMGRKAAASTGHSSAKDGGVEPEPSSLPEDVRARIANLARRRIASAWRIGVGSLIEGLMSLLALLIIGAFLGLAGVTVYLERHLSWIAAAYIGAAVLAALLRRALRESFAHLQARSDLTEVASDLERILRPAGGSASSLLDTITVHPSSPCRRLGMSIPALGYPYTNKRDRLRGARHSPFFAWRGTIEARQTCSAGTMPPAHRHGW